MEGLHHRFAVILAADCAYYSRQVEENAEQAVAALEQCKDDFVESVLAHEGREFGIAGDSLMAEFPSPIEAMRAARDFQAKNHSRKSTETAPDFLQFRIGLHEGDVIAEDGGLYGDVVNIAARLQELARPGGIVISSQVYGQVHKEPGLFFKPLGSHFLKNIAEPVQAYEVRSRDSRINWRRIGFRLAEYRPALIATLVIVFGVIAIKLYIASLPGVSGPIAVDPGVTPVPVGNSIAVLPFVDLSPEGDREYFADGISEEILNVLARIPDLQVTSRSSSFKFKGKDVHIPTVAEKLGVAFVLEGSVRKFGERLRITAQLTDARSDAHVWSETYDHDLVDIFAVPDEISAAIAGAIGTHLVPQIEAVPRGITTAYVESHEAYLRGRYLLLQRTQTSVEGAVRELEKAITLDPGYASAHAELAVAILLLDNTPGTIARAAKLAEYSLALDPTLAEAHNAIALVLRRQWKLEEALTHYQRAIQINPSYSTAYHMMAITLGATGLGRYDEGFAATTMALRLDPLSIPALINRSLALKRMGRLDDARLELDKLATIAPDVAPFWHGDLNWVGGKWAQVALGHLDGLQVDPENGCWRLNMALSFAVLGLEKEALAISGDTSPLMLRILGRPEQAVTAADARLKGKGRNYMDLGLALASAGDYDRAGPMLEEMWQKSGGVISFRGLFQPASAAALIAIRREAGDEAGISELVAAIRDNVRRYHEAGITGGDEYYSVDYETGLADYMSGERESGLALIAKSVEDGWFIRPREAYLQVLYDDPGFTPIHAAQEARRAREREKFLAVVCTNNPYETVWQPAEGTCEHFAVERG
jgi:TolB-like protein/class 3 adenylate cyclase/tetratricopeptide (TPR) repeat protein